METPTCRECGAEIMWVQFETRRLALDVRSSVYRVVTTMATPAVKKCSSVLGMEYVAMVDHKDVCKPRPAIRPLKEQRISDEEEGVSKRSRDRIASEVARYVAQGGPMKGRTYFFDTIVANRRTLRQSRGMVRQVVLSALEEYEKSLAERSR